jgi:hypothetical protein
MPLQIGTDTPAAFPVAESAASGPPPRKPSAAGTTEPPPFPVEPLPAVTWVGLNLARKVLRITTYAIAALILYLFVMDVIVPWNIRGVYRTAPPPGASRVGAEFWALRDLDQLSVDLAAARSDPAHTWSPDSLRNAQILLNVVGRLPGVASEQKAQLNACIPPPTDATRAARLDRCLVAVETLTRAASDAASRMAEDQCAREAALWIQEHRLRLHQFWLQAAQLVLLNLLLPVLTALLGYIFGTHHAATGS